MGRSPLYLTVAEAIREWIESGEWRPGDRLPNEHDLAQRFYVSRVTLREALGLLERDGLVLRRHGIGSFVERKPVHASAELSKLEPFALGIRRAGFKTSEELLSLTEATLTNETSAILGQPPNSTGYRLEMLRRMEQVPVIYSLDYVRSDAIDPDAFRARGRNILDYLAETGRTRVAYANLRIKAIQPDQAERKTLECDHLEPVICLSGVAYSPENMPLYVTRFLIRSTHYELTLLRH